MNLAPVLALFLLLLAAVSASAQGLEDDWKDCRVFNPDVSIRGCTAVLEREVDVRSRTVAFYNRGMAYADKGDWDRAIQDYEEALKLDPEFTEAIERRSGARVDRERAAAARGVIVEPAPPSYAPAQNTVLPGRRLALVLGIDSYRQIPALNAARNDAEAIAGTLKNLGFDVLDGLDLDRRGFNRRLTDFENTIRNGDSVFFFFAGHAIAHQGRNWLLPVDMPEIAPGRESELVAEAFAADDILARFKARGAAMSVLVLDACRDNPFERPGDTRSAFGGTRGLERMSTPQGVFVLYSAAEKERALDRLPNDDHPNSVFTRVLVEELERPGRRLVDIALDTQQRVQELARKAGRSQLPAYYDNYGGRFTLK